VRAEQPGRGEHDWYGQAVEAAGALVAVEGPNEPNNFPVTYQNQTSSYSTTFAPVANFQRDLYLP